MILRSSIHAHLDINTLMPDEKPLSLMSSEAVTAVHRDRKGKDRARKRHRRKLPGREEPKVDEGNLDKAEGQIRSALTGKGQHGNKKGNLRPKKHSHTSEDAIRKTARPQSQGGRRRHGNRSKQTDGKYKQINLIDDKLRKELALQREDEINQCSHLLTAESFKLFKRGQHVTSYGFTRNQNMLGMPNCKFIISVPLDYPKSPIRLQCNKATAQQQSLPLEEKLDRLTKNFNFKSRQMVLKGIPIISQLNYLVQKADTLCLPDYKLIDRREQEFYAKFA